MHFHFEVRLGANTARWGDSIRDTVPSQDPLQTPGIFLVSAGVRPPDLQEIGITRQHPGDTAFVKNPPNSDANGPVYFFAEFVDREPKTPSGVCDPNYYRLGLRAVRFQPDGATQPGEIRPQHEAAIGQLRPPWAGKQKGFARYGVTEPDRCDFFRYWWRWETSSYAEERKGPRSLLLTGEDHAPSTADFHFTFGPQVTNNMITPIAGPQYQFAIRAHLGTNTPAAFGNTALFVQPDQYKLEIIQINQ